MLWMFTSHHSWSLRDRLSVLVEASPVDRSWGIGLAADDEHASNPLKWRGLNLLGFAPMAMRRESVP